MNLALPCGLATKSKGREFGTIKTLALRKISRIIKLLRLDAETGRRVFWSSATGWQPPRTEVCISMSSETGHIQRCVLSLKHRSG